MVDDSLEKQRERLCPEGVCEGPSLKLFLAALSRDWVRQPTLESVQLDFSEREASFLIQGWVMHPAMLTSLEWHLSRMAIAPVGCEVTLLPTWKMGGPDGVEPLFAKNEKQAAGLAQPVPGSPVVHIWSEEAPIRPLHRVGDFVLCQSETGYLGWVEGGSLRLGGLSKRSSESGGFSPERLRELTESWHGTPYLWGGTGPEGIDCSGFSQWVMRRLGVEIARDAHQQMLGGRLVATHDHLVPLLPGDLLFFTLEDGRIGHVGVSLGGWEVVHAERPAVTVFSLHPEDSHYNASRARHFICAKRYLVTGSGLKT
jgi:hypothetical protein